MISSLNPTTREMERVAETMKTVSPKTPEGEFINACNLLASYCFGYAREVMTNLMMKDPDVKVRGTPSQIAMEQTISDLVRDLVFRQSALLASDERVIAGAQAFWKRVSPRSRKTIENVDVMVADVSLLKLAQITSMGSDKEMSDAIITYNLLSKPCHGSA